MSASKRKKNNAFHKALAAVLSLVVIAAVFFLADNFFFKDRAQPVSGPSSLTGTTASSSTEGSVSLSAIGASSEASSTVGTAAAKTSAQTAPATGVTALPADGHYIQPAGSVWYLRLVNPWNPLPDGFDQTVPLVSYDSHDQFDNRAVAALGDMVSAGQSEGVGLVVASTYRSVALQTTLYNNKVAELKNQGLSQADAEAQAATVVARPGTSEHNTGLAADIYSSSYMKLEIGFADTAAGKWLKANAAQYGFILRYPADKTAVTGVSFEPWHYRYVGVDAAREIMSRGITLEEYLQEKGM